MEEGLLDNLPGEGRPIPGIDESYDPMWWVRAWVRRERLGRVLVAAAAGRTSGRRADLQAVPEERSADR